VKRRDFLSVSTGLVAGRIGLSLVGGGLGDQFFKGPLRVESAFDIFDPWTSQVVAEIGGWSTAVNQQLMRIPLEKFESYLNNRENIDFAFVNSAMWEKNHMIANLFSWVPFGHSASQHQAWLAGDGQNLMDQYFAQFGLKAVTFGATGGISGFWVKDGHTDLASLQGGKIFGRPLVRHLFRRFGLAGVEVSEALSSFSNRDVGFKLASGVESAKRALHRGEIAVLDWMSPHRDLQYGIPQQDVNYVTFEPNVASRPSVFFLGVTTLKKWQKLQSHEAEINALAARTMASSGKLWQRFDEGAVAAIEATGSSIVNFDAQDVVRLKRHSKELIAYYATNDLERKVISSYIKAV